MPVYLVFIREKTLDESRIEAYCSALYDRPIKALPHNRHRVTLEGFDVKGVIVAEFPSLEVARTWYENPAHQAAAQRQLDSWLADMEYCDRF